MTGPALFTAQVRAALSRDAPACAAILNDWIDATPWMPRVNEPDDAEAYLRDIVLPRQTFWVAEEPSATILGFLALDPTDSLVSMLYLASEARGRSIGKALLNRAKAACPDGLGLWTFVANTGARRFYEREGFREFARTDGDNEEGLPDILFRWAPEDRA